MNDTTATAADEAVIGGQITEVKPDNALVVMDPEKYATELFDSFNAELAQAKRRANREKYDITTKEGMSTAKDLKGTFVKLRTRADKTKTEAKRPIDIAGKAILARFNAFRDAAEAEELKHAQAIDAETARREAEQAAKEAEQRAITEAIEARIAHIRGIPVMAVSLDSAALALKVEELAGKQIDPNLYPGAYLNDAVEALNETVDKLREIHQIALNAEAEQRQIEKDRAELEQLKAQQEARDKADREAEAERQRQAEAERQQAADRQAAADKQLADMRSEQERQQNIMQAIMGIQKCATFDGTARELLDAVDAAEKLETGEVLYGAMAGMAQMAQGAAVVALKAKYARALAEELPLAWDEALAENYSRNRPAITAALTAIVNDPANFVTAHELAMQMPGVFEHASDDAIELAERTRPTLAGMLDVLADHYGETTATVLGWLREMVVA